MNLRRILVPMITIGFAVSSGVFAQVPTPAGDFTGFSKAAYNPTTDAAGKNLFEKCFANNSPSNSAGMVDQILKQWGIDLSKDSDGKLKNAGPTSKMSAACGTAPDMSAYVGRQASSECRDFSAGGIFDPTLVDAKLKSLEKDSKKYAEFKQCSEDKLQGIQDQLQCLQLQGSQLSQAMAPILSDYQRNLEKTQKEIEKAQGEIKNRQALNCSAIVKLGLEEVPKDCANMGIMRGPSDIGLMQLKQLAFVGDPNDKEKKGGMLGQLKFDVDNLKRVVKTIDQRKVDFKQREKLYPLVYAKQCFYREAMEGYNVNAQNNVSPWVHLLERYEENAHINKNGKIDRSANAGRNAKKMRANLQTTLQRLFNELPDGEPSQSFGWATDQNGNPTQAPAVRRSAVSSMEAFETEMGRMLKQYNNDYTNVTDFVRKSMRFCYDQGIAKLKVMQGSSAKSSGDGDALTSGYLAEKNGIKDYENGIRGINGQKIDSYLNFYKEAINSLWDIPFPADPTTCQNGNLAQQQDCLNRLNDSINGIVRGTQEFANRALTLKGTKTPTMVGCKGLDGCVDRLNRFIKDNNSWITGTVSDQSKNVTAMNQATAKYTGDMAKMFAPQAQSLQDGIKELNRAIADLGGKPIVVPDAKSEALKPNEANFGLYGVPQNALAVINGSSEMSPKIPDFSDGSVFNKSLESIAQAKAEIEDRTRGFTKLGSMQDTLIALKSSCEGDMKAKVGEVSDLISSELDTNRCMYNKTFCEGSWKNKNGSIESVIQDINSIVGLEGSGANLSGYACVSANYDEVKCESDFDAALARYITPYDTQFQDFKKNYYVSGKLQPPKNSDTIMEFISFNKTISTAAISDADRVSLLTSFEAKRSVRDQCLTDASTRAEKCSATFSKLLSKKGTISTVKSRVSTETEENNDDAQ